MHLARVILAGSIFFVGWAIDLGYGDGAIERFTLAMALVVMMMATFCLGMLCERYQR